MLVGLWGAPRGSLRVRWLGLGRAIESFGDGSPCAGEDGDWQPLTLAGVGMEDKSALPIDKIDVRPRHAPLGPTPGV